MSGPPPPGGFNPGAFEFRPGGQQPFVPRGQQQYPQQQAYDQYGAYGQQQGQGGYYPQQGGYPQYGQQQGYYPQQQQQGYVPPNRAYQPPQIRNVQGFQPPNLPPTSSSPAPTPEPRTLNTAAPAGKPVSLSIGGAPKAAPSLSIGGAPKPAPSLSIGGAPKAAPSLKIGGSGGAPVSLSIGGKKSTPALVAEKDEPAPAKAATPKPAETATVPEPAAPEPQAAASAPSDPVPVEDEKPAAAPAPSAPANDAQARVVASSGTATPTNYSKVSAKNDSDAIEKEQAAAGAEVLADLYGGDDVKDTNTKPHLNIIFTGHVDAGKSTTGGQLMFLTGAVDKRTMEKYEQEAKAAGRETWYLSFALDSSKEERAKGQTVSTGRAFFESEKRRYTILDAPGHKTFVPSMIAGAAQADVALLVLSARKGEFETGFERDGQTREHAMLIKNNGINKIIIVVNKMDDITVQWDKERFDEICKKITPFLKSVGFNPKTDITFIPVSAQMGENMKDRVEKKVAPWYEGPSLLEHLDEMPIQDRDINAPFVFPVSEKYNDLGCVVVGKVESGHVKKGQSLLLMPNRTTVEVAAITTETGEEIEATFAGDNSKIRLTGISDKDVQPGYVLTSPQRPIKAVTAFKADISIIEARNIISSGYTAVLHVHTLAEEVTLTSLLHYYDKKTKRKSKKAPQFAKAGMMVQVLIETSAPICIDTYKNLKQLGRFSLRDEG